MLFVTLANLPTATATTVAGVRHLTVVGSTAAIGEPVAALLGTFVERLTRLSGQDRYATSVAVADQLLRSERADLGWVWAATGSSWADAATAGPEVARVGDVLVLIGGEAAISGAAAARLKRRIS